MRVPGEVPGEGVDPEIQNNFKNLTFNLLFLLNLKYNNDQPE